MIRTHARFAIIVLFCCFQTAFAEDHNIVTVAGTSSVGDGGPAIAALITFPYVDTFDSAGNFYFTELPANRVRKVDTSGVITTVAGNGISGFSGDGGPATAAQLNFPAGVTVDRLGNLYFADTHNQRIRKVDTFGIITTVAGNGIFGFSGDGGPATAAQLSAPGGITSDPLGNLFIVDSGNSRIRKIDPSGVITSVAGSGIPGTSGDGGPAIAARLNSPEQVTFDQEGNLYIVSIDNKSIRRVDTAGIITTVGTGRYFSNVARGPLGDLYFTEFTSGVWKIAPSGIIIAVAGNGIPGFSGDGGPATAAQLISPHGITFDPSGNLYIADSGNNRIRKVDTLGIITTIVGDSLLGDGGPATAAQLRYPNGVTVDKVGNLFILDGGNQQIRKVNTSGFISTVAGNGTSGFSGDGGPATAAQFSIPQGFTADRLGNLYVADTYNFRVRKIDISGIITTVAGSGISGFSGDGGPAQAATLNHPCALAVDPLGNLFIADLGNSRIRKVDTSGMITTVAGNGILGFSGDGGPAQAATLNQPCALAVDPLGNLFIADLGNSRIRKIDTSGMITTVAGNGILGFSGDGGPAIAAQLRSSLGVSVDPLGNLFIADIIGVRKIDISGIITTVAGNGTLGFSGDGGPATAAQFNVSFGLALDQSGNLYIADSYNKRIRRLNVATTISLDHGELATKPNGKWFSTYIEFPSGRDPNTVSLGSVMIQAIDAKSGEVRQSLRRTAGSPTELIDTDKDHVPDQLMVKFDRSIIASWATGEPELTLRVQGQFIDGLYFSGDTSIPLSDSK